MLNQLLPLSYIIHSCISSPYDFFFVIDVKDGYKGRSPLLAFCDAMMSTVKMAANKPNEGLSLDCVQAGIKENRLDLIYHWLTQDK